MPELPEVETVRRGLEAYLSGRRLERVELLDPRLVTPASTRDIEARLTGRVVTRLGRRGKYLLLHLEGGDVAIHHLRMTGSFSAMVEEAAAADPGRHVRARYHARTADGSMTVVRYHDPRRFGTLAVLDEPAAQAYLAARLGPEPLSGDFSGAWLHERLGRRTAPVKAVLLDQRVVAGVGNIYADEALFQAGIAPGSPGDAITRPAADRLAAAVVDRLELAIEVGGSTLRDYRNVEGGAGGMQERFLVYGRAGEPCSTCGRQLRAGRIAGRSTVWCGHCQPAARRRRRRRS